MGDFQPASAKANQVRLAAESDNVLVSNTPAGRSQSAARMREPSSSANSSKSGLDAPSQIGENMQNVPFPTLGGRNDSIPPSWSPSLGSLRTPQCSSSPYSAVGWLPSTSIPPMKHGSVEARRPELMSMHNLPQAQEVQATAIHNPASLAFTPANWVRCPSTIAAASQLANIGVGVRNLSCPYLEIISLTSWKILYILQIGAGINPHVTMSSTNTCATGSINPPIVNTGNNGPMCVQPGDWVCSTCGFVVSNTRKRRAIFCCYRLPRLTTFGVTRQNWRRRRVCMRCFPFADPNEMSQSIASGAFLAAQLAAGVEPMPDTIASLTTPHRSTSVNASRTSVSLASSMTVQPTGSQFNDLYDIHRPVRSTPPLLAASQSLQQGSRFGEALVDISDLEELMSRTLSLRAASSSGGSSSRSSLGGARPSVKKKDGIGHSSSSSSDCLQQTGASSRSLSDAVPGSHTQARSPTLRGTNVWCNTLTISQNKNGGNNGLISKQDSSASLAGSEHAYFSTHGSSFGTRTHTVPANSCPPAFDRSSESLRSTTCVSVTGSDRSECGVSNRTGWLSSLWTEQNTSSYASTQSSLTLHRAQTSRETPLSASSGCLDLHTCDADQVDGERLSAFVAGKCSTGTRPAICVDTNTGLPATSAASEQDEVFVPSADERRAQVQPISPSAYKTMMLMNAAKAQSGASSMMAGATPAPASTVAAPTTSQACKACTAAAPEGVQTEGADGTCSHELLMPAN